MRVELDERYKVTSRGVRTCPAANNQAEVCVLVLTHDITSRVDTDCARSYFGQACQLNQESIGTEVIGSWIRFPRETDFISRIEKT